MLMGDGTRRNMTSSYLVYKGPVTDFLRLHTRPQFKWKDWREGPHHSIFHARICRVKLIKADFWYGELCLQPSAWFLNAISRRVCLG